MPRQHPIQMPSGHNFYLIRAIISDSHRCARFLSRFIFIFGKKERPPAFADGRIILRDLMGRFVAFLTAVVLPAAAAFPHHSKISFQSYVA